MARWKLTIQGKGVRQASVQKLADKMKSEFGDDVYVHVADDTPPESRADRLSAALSNVSDARGEVEGLRDELHEWLDGMPENLQSGSKADALNEAIDALSELADKLEDAEGADVSFPSMMG